MPEFVRILALVRKFARRKNGTILFSVNFLDVEKTEGKLKWRLVVSGYVISIIRKQLLFKL